MSDVVAAIDVGTNSFHLVVARVDETGRFEVIEREREMVRLGSGSGDLKLLEPEAIDRGIEALGRLGRVAKASGARLRAVATSAVREADNADEFLHRARDEAGVEVDEVEGKLPTLDDGFLAVTGHTAAEAEAEAAPAA